MILLIDILMFNEHFYFQNDINLMLDAFWQRIQYFKSSQEFYQLYTRWKINNNKLTQNKTKTNRKDDEWLPRA